MAEAIAARSAQEWREAEAEFSVERRVTELERKFKEAFPNGDYAGHCRYHEIQIEMLLENKRLRRAVVEKTIAGLVWAGMLAMGLALLNWAKVNLK